MADDETGELLLCWLSAGFCSEAGVVTVVMARAPISGDE
jgi:hypothetical protein